MEMECISRAVLFCIEERGRGVGKTQESTAEVSREVMSSGGSPPQLLESL